MFVRSDSGGGEHDHWLLDEPLDVSSAGGQTELENTLKGIADVLGGDPAVTDAARIIRGPGTRNIPGPA